MEYILVAISILFWGSTACISKFFFANVSVVNILAFGSLAAFIFFLILCGVRGKLKTLVSLPLKTIAAMIGVGSLAILFYTMFLQLGMAVLPGQQAFVIQYLWPAMIIIWSLPINGESIDFGKALAVLFSFVGVIIVAVNGDIKQLLGGNLFGVSMCLLAAVTYGLYSALVKKMTYDKELALLVAFAFVALVSFIYNFVRGTFQMPSLFELGGCALYGLVINAIPFLLWGMALSRGNTAIIANLAYLTPVVSLFMTHFLLGEEVTIYSVLGLALILAGIGLQLIVQKKTPQSLRKGRGVE